MVALVILTVYISHHLHCVQCNLDKAQPQADAKRKLPKDPLFMTDIDLENLYDQWEESDDEPLPPDELPPHKRPTKPGLNLNDGKLEDMIREDPEKVMQDSKKGKTVMAFVSLAGSPSKEETELLTQLWQVGLNNNHIKCQRYVVADDRAIFVFHDGIQAFEAKDYLLDQPQLKEYSIDSRSWRGKGYPVEHPHAKNGKSATSETLSSEQEAKVASAGAAAASKRDEL